jgi:MIP family channel proteins
MHAHDGAMSERRGRDEPPEPTIGVRLAAEAIGAFALVFVAAGADTFARLTGDQVPPFARALAPGLLVMALIYAIGDRSGAHFNPGVTLAFTLRNLFPRAWVVPYWLAQLVGAVLAAGLLRVLFGEAAAAGVTTPHVAAGTALVIEIVLTVLLVTVILATADRYQLIGSNAAIAVGATIALCGLIALPLEGASMNPARSAGPAIVNVELSNLWIYVVGPAVGAVVAVGIARLLHGPTPDGAQPREAAMGKL